MKSHFSIAQFLNILLEKQDLSLDESKLLMEEMLKGNVSQSQIAAILVALRMKGESVEEILGFIQVMREHMVKIKTNGLVIDVCGTGGDGKRTFNISTAVAFVIAGAGVMVAKHGNRNASSICGSADVLETLGININLTPKQAEMMLEKTKFAFLFAPLFHPAMKYVGPVRKELKVRTVFNYLGPFVSPAGVKRQIIGVPSIKLAEKLAKVAVNLNYEHLMIVSSEDGLDEISLSGRTHIFEVKGKKAKKMIIDSRDFGFKKVSVEEIQGGDAKRNAEIIKDILNGKGEFPNNLYILNSPQRAAILNNRKHYLGASPMNGSYKNIVLLNSAAALIVAGKAGNYKEGIQFAKDSIDNGSAQKVLKDVIYLSNNL